MGLRAWTLAAGLAAAAAAQSSPVAFVTDVQGDVRAGGKPLAFLAELQVDQRVVLEKGARFTVLYAQSGSEFAAQGPAEVAVGAGELQGLSGTPPARRAIAQAPQLRTVQQVAQSATASVRMRSVPPPAPVVEPAALQYPRDGRIATLRPVLRWSGPAGPKGYAIVITAADGKPAWSGTARASPFRLPVKLAGNAHYTWNVTGARPLGEAAFETLDAGAAEQAGKHQAAAKGFPDKVMQALRLQELGATADAREAWAALARERPDVPQLATLAR